MLEVVKYGAYWCSPCKRLDPIIHELQEDYKDIKFRLVDIESDEGRKEAAEKGIMGIPHVRIYKDNKEVTRFNGVRPRDFFEELFEKEK